MTSGAPRPGHIHAQYPAHAYVHATTVELARRRCTPAARRCGLTPGRRLRATRASGRASANAGVRRAVREVYFTIT
jgi:hypothetical protein